MLDLTRYCEYCEDANLKLSEFLAENDFSMRLSLECEKGGDVYCVYCACMTRNGDVIE